MKHKVNGKTITKKKHSKLLLEEKSSWEIKSFYRFK